MLLLKVMLPIQYIFEFFILIMKFFYFHKNFKKFREYNISKKQIVKLKLNNFGLN